MKAGQFIPKGLIETNMVPTADGQSSLYWPLGMASNEVFLAQHPKFLCAFNNVIGGANTTNDTAKFFLPTGLYTFAVCADVGYLEGINVQLFIEVNGNIVLTAFINEMPEGDGETREYKKFVYYIGPLSMGNELVPVYLNTMNVYTIGQAAFSYPFLNLSVYYCHGIWPMDV